MKAFKSKSTPLRQIDASAIAVGGVKAERRRGLFAARAETTPAELARRIFFYNALLTLFLLCPGISEPVRTMGGGIAAWLGPLLLLPGVLRGLRASLLRNGRVCLSPRPFRRWLPALIALGLLDFVAGQMIQSAAGGMHGQKIPATLIFLAASLFLAAALCLLGAVVSLISGPIALAHRMRMLFDSLMILTAMAAFSWYFLLGPTVLRGAVGVTIQGAPGTMRAVSDLILLCALLAIQAGDARRRPVTLTLALGLTTLVFADTLFGYQTLHHTLRAGHWYDLGWPLGAMLLALAARWNMALERQASEATLMGAPRPLPARLTRVAALWQSLLPYVTLVAVGGLVMFTWRGVADARLDGGVYFGALMLVVLLLLRQHFALLENQNLAVELSTLKDNLETDVARRTEELSARTEQLTSLLQLTTAINNTLEVDAVLAVAARHTLQAFQADALVMWLLKKDPAGESFSAPIYLHQGLSEHRHLLPFLEALPLHEQTTTFTLPQDSTVPNQSSANCLRGSLRWRGELLGMIGVIRWQAGFERTEAVLMQSFGMEVGTALENARQFHAARAAADRDPVTDLFNHRAIHQHLDKACDAAQESASELSLLMMDLNNFKYFNDTYGHPVGDEVLRRVSKILTEECGASDKVGRYGGDEFIIVLPGQSGAAAIEVAQNIKARMSREAFQRAGEERTIPVSLSFGVATLPTDTQNRHELLTIADANLYAAKNSDDGIRGSTEQQRANRCLRSEESFSVLDAMVTAVDNKDSYTRRHSEDVTEYALWIAEEMGMSEETMRTIRIGGLLHDVGKIGVPDEILRKPGRLTAEEYEVLKRHPQLGALIVGGVPGMESIMDAVRYHHERWDGAGYPEALQGEDIPILGRILAVADAVSAMTTDRPYRRGMPWETAVAEVRVNIGVQFDPAVAAAFLRAAEKRGLISAVPLTLLNPSPAAPARRLKHKRREVESAKPARLSSPDRQRAA